MPAAAAREATALPAYAPGRQRRVRRPEGRPARTRQQPQRRRVTGTARRTASVAIHLPESTAVVGISRSRVWIAVIGVLLVGIVAINVVTVSYGAMSGKINSEIQKIDRQNSILKSQQTTALSMPRVEDAASAAGMVTPEPTDINYRSFSSGDIAAAAQRLATEGG